MSAWKTKLTCVGYQSRIIKKKIGFGSNLFKYKFVSWQKQIKQAIDIFFFRENV